MIKWEYKSMITDSLENPTVKDWGDEGWEAVGFSMTMVQQGLSPRPITAILILFKRIKTESTN